MWDFGGKRLTTMINESVRRRFDDCPRFDTVVVTDRALKNTDILKPVKSTYPVVLAPWELWEKGTILYFIFEKFKRDGHRFGLVQVCQIMFTTNIVAYRVCETFVL